MATLLASLLHFHSWIRWNARNRRMKLFGVMPSLICSACLQCSQYSSTRSFLERMCIAFVFRYLIQYTDLCGVSCSPRPLSGREMIRELPVFSSVLRPRLQQHIPLHAGVIWSAVVANLQFGATDKLHSVKIEIAAFI